MPQTEPEPPALLVEEDVLVAFHSAAKLLGLSTDFSIEASFYPYAGLKSTVYVDRHEKKIVGRVSDGLKAASPEQLLGLALDLTAKVFRRAVPDAATRFVNAYRQGVNGEQAFALHDALRKTRGRRRTESAQGAHVDLDAVLAKVWSDYPLTLQGLEKPAIHWTTHKSRQRLAFYDSAFHDVVVSRAFDRQDTPAYFLEYLVFHELLHAKHGTRHGARNRVHHRAFKEDERKFALYKEAMARLRHA